MIDIFNVKTFGFEPAIEGMRNPLNSWEQSDSYLEADEDNNYDIFGPSDKDLAVRLVKSGPDHRKFIRMIMVSATINAPLYWWKEYDTYKVGTVANSCSTMHRIHTQPFDISMFSTDHLDKYGLALLNGVIDNLEANRRLYLETKDKKYWWNMIQMLPSSYMQRRTVMMSYETARNMYHSRKNHKLDEWHKLCEMFENLPAGYLITD